MKKPLSLLLCILTLLSCIGCESLVNGGNGTTEPTEITTANQGENPFGEVLERLKENVSFSTRKDETQLYLLSDGEKESLTVMLKSIGFLKIDKAEYKDKSSVSPRDKTQWIEIIFGNTDEESEACVLTVFSDGMIYATHGASDTEEYFVSAEVAVVYYSFNAYITGLLVSDEPLKETTASVTTSAVTIQYPPSPLDEFLVRNDDGTVSLYNAFNLYKANITYWPYNWGSWGYYYSAEDKQRIVDVFKNIRFTEYEAYQTDMRTGLKHATLDLYAEGLNYNKGGFSIEINSEGRVGVSYTYPRNLYDMVRYFYSEPGAININEYLHFMQDELHPEFSYKPN